LSSKPPGWRTRSATRLRACRCDPSRPWHRPDARGCYSRRLIQPHLSPRRRTTKRCGGEPPPRQLNSRITSSSEVSPEFCLRGPSLRCEARKNCSCKGLRVEGRPLGNNQPVCLPASPYGVLRSAPYSYSHGCGPVDWCCRTGLASKAVPHRRRPCPSLVRTNLERESDGRVASTGRVAEYLRWWCHWIGSLHETPCRTASPSFSDSCSREEHNSCQVTKQSFTRAPAP
jgi:hypothetical protein